ncbi:hypothetical protein ETAA8_61030 [Anatilimnocola aggregata]|uniref:Uncharacterized protein n=2 Tax=Anatilimnocola aggregata TaxID=2528021 RepID=A0A517YL73_9BACT|nr:hypothetical protein ETAA8_61030 [Anatilimnocola aggregata]
MPANLDPYAVAPPVHIKAKPIRIATGKPVAKPSPTPAVQAADYSAVKVAAAVEVETVSLTIGDDEPPAPPQLLPISTVATSPVKYSPAKHSTASHYDNSIPVNPLRR